MPGLTFRGDKGATYGFTDEDGKQVTREARADGTVTAKNGFEERVFAGMGLTPVAASEKAAARKSSAAAKKAAAKAASEPEPEPYVDPDTPAETVAEEKK